MSNIAIKGATTGTGTFTIESPATNTDRTLTLPDEAGTVVTTGGADFTGQVTTTSGMGVGTASPTDSTLHVKNSSSGSALKVESNTGNNYINFYDGATRTALLGTADGSTNNFYVSNEANAPMLFRTNGTERMRIDSSGNVMIGTTSADSSVLNVERNTASVYGLKVEQTAGTVNFTINELIRVAIQSANAETPLQRFVAGGSTFGLIRINSTNNGTQYLTTSDYRLKENVVDMTDSVSRLKQLRPLNFNFIGNDVLAEGFLAHEVQEVVPTAVAGSKDAVDEDGNINPQMIEMQSMIPLLTGALQEAIAKIETLETTVADLQTRVTALESV